MGDPFQRSGSRIEPFTDGVFAIILTLLVLDLKLPDLPNHARDPAIWAAFRALAPKFISFAFSFLVVAVYWVNHHYFFHSVARTDRTFVWLNVNLLFWLCFIPFPTGVIGTHADSSLAAALYGITMFLCALSYRLLTGYACRARLFSSSEAEKDIVKRARSSWIGLGLYAVSIPLAFASSLISVTIFIVVPLIYFVPQKFETSPGRRRGKNDREYRSSF